MTRQKAEGRRQKDESRRPIHPSSFILLLSALCLLPSVCLAKNHAFSLTAHGDKVKGPQRLAGRPPGTCGQCHDQSGYDSGLFAPNDNDLCFTCHEGSGEWAQSAHASAARLDTGKCVSCHDPHGVKDGTGVVPALLDAREPELCLRCHDGSRGADIRARLTLAYRHGMDPRGRDRHVSCSDCHNSHRAVKDRIPPEAPAASSLMLGVSRVEVANGPAGTAPRTTLRAASDPTPANEYEICFKCHSSFTRLGPGQPDLALLTNPANPSFHPIQAAGKNAIDPRAFAGETSSTSIIACGDCHDSHGSSYRYLLARPSGTAERTDLCFACHAFDVYGNAGAPADVQRASRFNGPSTSGHAFHVGQQQIACAACHETHGSTRTRALIATGHAPGILAYTQTSNGGTCASTCHVPRTYSVNYAR